MASSGVVIALVLQALSLAAAQDGTGLGGNAAADGTGDPESPWLIQPSDDCDGLVTEGDCIKTAVEYDTTTAKWMYYNKQLCQFVLPEITQVGVDPELGFDTEFGHDFITVDGGERISGKEFPDVQGRVFTWSSDITGHEKGWKLCTKAHIDVTQDWRAALRQHTSHTQQSDEQTGILYVKGDVNAAACPEGKMVIVDLDECKAAATQMDVPFKMFETTISAPFGCYIDDHMAYFNRIQGTTAGSMTRRLCKTSAPVACQWGPEIKGKVLGDNSASQPAASLDDCKATCAALASCTSLNYKASTQECFPLGCRIGQPGNDCAFQMSEDMVYHACGATDMCAIGYRDQSGGNTVCCTGPSQRECSDSMKSSFTLPCTTHKDTGCIIPAGQIV